MTGIDSPWVAVPVARREHGADAEGGQGADHGGGLRLKFSGAGRTCYGRPAHFRARDALG